MKTTLRSHPAIGAMLVLGMAGSAVLSDGEAAQKMKPEASPAPAESPGKSLESQGVSKDDLKSYAEAAVVVKRISDTYRANLSTVQTPEERQTVQKEARIKMSSAVRDQGLTLAQYNKITAIAQMDPAVAEQIMAYMTDVR